MKPKLAIDPDIVALMVAEVAAGERAVTTAMRQAGTGLKSAWRTQITGAGTGTRLANSIRSANFPKSGKSLNAAALVWSNAPVIIGAHDTGPLIRSKSGLWLAIPTPAAGKSTRGGRITPDEWERRMGLRLRFIYRRRGPSLLVAEGLLTATARLVAQGESVAAATAAGTPTSLAWQRFGHFNGAITRNGSPLGNVISAEVSYSNGLDRIETIRGDGRIDGADPAMAALSGRIEVRFSDTTLITQAIDGTPCELEFAYSLGASASFTFTAYAVQLPRWIHEMNPSRDLCIRAPRGRQLRTQTEDPERPHALRTHLQDLKIRAGTIHPEPDPPDAGTEHPAHSIAGQQHCSRRLYCPRVPISAGWRPPSRPSESPLGIKQK